MAAVFDKPSLLQRALPLFQGFDGALAVGILLPDIIVRTEYRRGKCFVTVLSCELC